ncbi:hypothetical protein HDU77_010555 [Chytriomyces hyalinus]|nr:hypothetical protein HDU77_010555 [Chytriomyces hyalinus]
MAAHKQQQQTLLMSGPFIQRMWAQQDLRSGTSFETSESMQMISCYETDLKNLHNSLMRRAIVDENTTPNRFNISDSDPTIEDFDSYFCFEKDSCKYCFGMKHPLLQITNQILSNWANSPNPVTMVILKHGNALRTTALSQQYDKAVLQPVIADRGGAPAQALHTEVMAQLRERHESSYTASLITWRLWANEILNLPVPLQANAINGPPPVEMIQLFNRIPTAAEVQLQELRSTMTLAREVLGSCWAKLEPIKLCAQELTRRVESFELVIGTFQSAVDALQDSLGPYDGGNGAAVTLIPNIPDSDHAYLLDA